MSLNRLGKFSSVFLDQEFHISSVGFVSGTSDVADVIGFRNIFPGGSSTGFHYFANGAFSTPGVYGAMLLSTDASRLTVTLVRDGVPEPATWAMMLAGFFGLGGVLRRRRALSA